MKEENACSWLKCDISHPRNPVFRKANNWLHPSFPILHPCAMPWQDTPVHVLDFEGSRRSGIVEFGVVTLHRGKIAATHTRLCAPFGPIEAAEAALHGINAMEAAKTDPFTQEHDLFLGLRRSGLFAAHHAPVERTLLRRIWPIPPASPDFAAENPESALRIADWGPWLDTRRIYEHLYPNLPSYQLGELIGKFHINDELAALAEQLCPPKRRRPHCALYDALAAALLLARLAGDTRSTSASLGTLIGLSVSTDEAALLNQDEFALGE